MHQATYVADAWRLLHFHRCIKALLLSQVAVLLENGYYVPSDTWAELRQVLRQTKHMASTLFLSSSASTHGLKTLYVALGFGHCLVHATGIKRDVHPHVRACWL